MQMVDVELEASNPSAPFLEISRHALSQHHTTLPTFAAHWPLVSYFAPRAASHSARTLTSDNFNES